MNRRTPRAVPRTLAALGAVLALVPGLSACGDIGHDGLIVGSDLTYPPYAYYEGKAPAGFDPDFMREIGERLDEKVSFHDTRVEQLVPNLKAGHIDLIASALYITPERAKQVEFIPYFSTGNSIVVRADDAPVRTMQELCGKVVATIKGGDMVGNFRTDVADKCRAAGKPPVDVREFTTDPEGTQAMLSGQVDAQVTDAGVATTLVDSGNARVKITSDELFYPVPVGLAIWKGDTSGLREKLGSAIDGMKADGTYDALLEKYNLAPVDQHQVDEIITESTK